MRHHRRSSPVKKRAPRLRVERLETRELFSATMTPLEDLGTGTYQGFEGGLYPNGTDTPPAATESFALSLAQQIVPLDASGNPDPVNGKIVMTSIGMSNTGVEFMTFIPQANADPTKNPQLDIVNGAQGGKDALSWLDPQATAWNVLDQDLAAAGVTPQQVQVVWFKEALQRPWTYGEFPLHSQAYQTDIETIDRNILIRYPHTKLVYMSTRTHAYTTEHTSPNPEPYAYETGFGVKWAIEDQINGVNNLNYDPSKGPVVAPLMLWGPYIWATDTPRSDGFTWTLDDVSSTDFTHPSNGGRAKVANELLAYFKTDPTATLWFLKPTPAGQGPSVTVSASTQTGTAPLTVQFTASATDPGGGTITQYAWTYDDGGFSLDQNPTKNFLVPGTYNVHLTVSDSLGNTTQETIPITVNATGSLADTTTAVASSGSSPTYGQQVTFTATVSTLASGTPTGTVQFVIDGLNFGSPVPLTSNSGVQSATMTVSSLSAGTHSIQAFYSGDTNFNSSTGTLTGGQLVNTAPLTITADDESMVYGGTVPALTASYQGFVNGDTSTSLTTQPTLSTVPANSHAGGYTITASGAVDANYSISYVSGTLTITPAPLTITADNQSLVYGSALPMLTASYSGLVNGDTPGIFSSSPNTAPVLSTVPPNSNVGSYAITVAAAANPDYTITFASGTLTVTPAPLTIIADNKSLVPGDSLPALTASYQGFVNGDTSASLTMPVTLATVATAASSAGAYPITASGATDPNYTITFLSGTLTVGQAGTTTTVSSSRSNPAFGQQVNLTAIVSVTALISSTPSGTVQFQVDGENFGDPVAVSSSNGVTSAILNTSALPIGRLSITAQYSGDQNFTSSLGTTSVVSGTENQRWVSQTYLDLLNRPVDSFGLDTWTTALSQGATRTAVALAVESSPEYLTNVVEGYYRAYLHRDADPSGLSSWLSLLGSGGTLEQVQTGIMSSPEYFQNRGGNTALGYLNALYQDALSRAIDPTGQAVFSAALAGGSTPAVVAAALFSSDEYRQDLIRADFAKFLHRPVDDFGLTFFLVAQRAGTTDQEVTAAIVGSGEYFSDV